LRPAEWIQQLPRSVNNLQKLLCHGIALVLTDNQGIRLCADLPFFSRSGIRGQKHFKLLTAKVAKDGREGREEKIG